MSQLGSDVARLFLSGAGQGSSWVQQAIEDRRRDDAMRQAQQNADRNASENARQFDVSAGLQREGMDQRGSEFDRTFNAGRADQANRDENVRSDNTRADEAATWSRGYQGALHGVAPQPQSIDPSFVGPPSPQQMRGMDNDQLLAEIAKHARIADEPKVTPDMLRAHLSKMRSLAQANGGVVTENVADMLAQPEERAVARRLVGKDPASYETVGVESGQDWGKRLQGYVPDATPEDAAWASQEAKNLESQGQDPAQTLLPVLQNRVQQRYIKDKEREKQTEDMLRKYTDSIESYRKEVEKAEEWLSKPENDPGPKPEQADGGSWMARQQRYVARQRRVDVLNSQMDALQKERDQAMRASINRPDAIRRDVGAMLDAPPAAAPKQPPARPGTFNAYAGGRPSADQELLTWAQQFKQLNSRVPTREEYLAKRASLTPQGAR